MESTSSVQATVSVESGVEEIQKRVEELKVQDKLQHKTHKQYFEDSYLFQSQGKVIATYQSEKSTDIGFLILDNTIFHPQGGGQPSDEGVISSADGSIKFIVKSLQPKDDAIIHFGIYQEDGQSFEIGQKVQLNIDEEKRRAYAQYHSAGHLLDVALNRMGITSLKPGKGYHFTSGAYVEYVGNVDNAIKDKLPKDLTDEVNKLIQEQKENPEGVWVKMCTYDEAGQVLKDGVPPYIPVGSDLRVIKLTELDSGCPCGGTHVKHVTDIPYIEVTKVLKKGKNTRVSYTIKSAQ